MRAAGGLVLGLVPVLLGLAACSIPPPPNEIRARDDQFAPYRELATGNFRPAFDGTPVAARLMARIDRQTGVTRTFLRMEIAYRGTHRRSYEIARNNRAEMLRLSHIANHGRACPKTQDCNISEVLEIDLPEADLRAAGPAGYSFKLFAKIGPEVIVTTPRDLITNLTALIDADRKAFPPPVAAASPTAKR
jgi:hypothetical protein